MSTSFPKLGVAGSSPAVRFLPGGVTCLMEFDRVFERELAG